MTKRKKIKQRTPRLTLAQRAEQNYEGGKVAAAVNWAKTTLRDKAVEDSIDELWVAGKILARAGETSEAIEVFEQLRDFGIDDQQLRFVLACCYATVGNQDAAMASINLVQLSEDSNLSFADSLANGGCLPQAIEVLQAALAVFPKAFAIEIELARYLSKNSAPDRAQEILEAVTQQDVPDSSLKARAWFNLGALLEMKNDTSKAEQAYRKAIETRADFPKPWINLGLLLKNDARYAEAVQLLNDAATHFPKHDKLNYLRAIALRLDDQTDQAIEILRAIVDHSSYTPAWEMLGRCHTEAGEIDAAISHYKRWLTVLPKNPIAVHMLMALQSEETPGRASAAYVTKVFDDFASTFEASLARIEYCGPAAFAQILEQNLISADSPEPSPSRIVLDAGCGTGLVGPVLRAYASELIGVDLSNEMLSKAREKNIYDRLLCKDLEALLEEHVEAYDLIVAADTFIYFGDLSELFPKCFAALKQGGWLAFSVEEGPLTGDQFYLQPHGRYVHSPQYIMEQLGECGIEGGSMNRVALRKEADKNVFAIVVAVQKPHLDEDSEETKTANLL